MKSFIFQKSAISPVIATILMVLIVVSAGASVFYFYKDISESAILEAEEHLGREINVLYAGLMIANSTTEWYSILNSGSVALNDIKIYEDGSLINTISSLAPGESYTEYVSLTEGRTLYAVASYGDDKKVIVAAPVISVGVSILSVDISALGASGRDVMITNLPVQSDLAEVD